MSEYMSTRPKCSVQGCENTSINATTKLCPGHWFRKYRTGTTTAEHDQAGVVESGHGLFGIMSRGDDWVLCHECGKTFKNLGSHIRHAHNMSAEDYRATHGIASNDALMCDSMRQKISAESTERIGSEGWKKFEQRRTETIKDSQPLAASATKRSGARKSHAAHAKSHPQKSREWVCVVCGRPVLPGRRTCSKKCADLNRAIGVGRRDARRLGEEKDFIRRPGSGRKLSRSDVLRLTGLNYDAFRSRVKRGQFPEHAGRGNWLPFWWESDVKSRRRQ